MEYFVLLALLASSSWAQDRAVFAHFMVSNTASYTAADWEYDITQAKAAHIDAFALNMAWLDPINDVALPLAFPAAQKLGFKLFFSFDYAANKSWNAGEIVELLTTYGTDPAYYYRGDQPLASTFEGPENGPDWTEIREATGCFFIPDWSSKGAKLALEAGPADGLLNWAAWPAGANNMNTDIDASYKLFLDGKPYMMPVSPWFYTNLPGYDKNWLWRGDDLWFTRWEQVFYVDPDYVEILTWNDYGESHYIGPLPPHASGFDLFTIGKAPFNYAANMPHDGWRKFLPYVIDTYKNGIASISQEGLVAWYRTQPAAACHPGGTTGNTASQLQQEYNPAVVVQDKVFYSALLASAADVTVSFDGSSQSGTWSNVPTDGIGIYHGSVPFNGRTGNVVITLSRGGSVIAQINEQPITTNCINSLENWNAWVGSADAATISPVSPSHNLSSLKCIAGSGEGNYGTLCQFTCEYGYCPLGPCTCNTMGVPADPPAIVNVNGYPAAGLDCSYEGLCSYACNHGVCPNATCSTDPSLKNACSSVVDPNAGLVCNKGSGTGNLEDLCNFTCKYGYCLSPCVCSVYGTQITPPAATGQRGYNSQTMLNNNYGPVNSLCDFACGHGYCPPPCTGVIPIDQFSDSIWCTPGDPTAWQCLNCTTDTPWWTDPMALDRWKESKADDAMAYLKAYLADTTNSLAQTQSLLDNLGSVFQWSPDVGACELNDGGCNSEANLCPVSTEPSVMAVAAIINSLQNMHQVYSLWFAALESAQASVDAWADIFNQTFNPSPSTSWTDELLDEILSSVSGAVGSKIWDLIKETSIVKGLPDNATQALEDAWDGIFGAASDYLQSFLPSASGTDVNLGNITSMANTIVQNQQQSLSVFFNTMVGSTGNASFAQFSSQVTGGVWLSSKNVTYLDVERTLETMIWSYLIPWVWSQNPTFLPLIAISDTPNDSSDPFDIDAAWQETGLSSSDIQSAYYSYNDKTFWVVAMKVCQNYEVYQNQKTCVDPAFTALPGLSSLGTDNYTNISVADIVISDYSAYKLNGNQNGYNLSAHQGGAYLHPNGSKSVYLYPDGAQTPGLWSFPMCNVSTLANNWLTIQADPDGPWTSCPTYPCCSCTELGLTADCTTRGPMIPGISSNKTLPSPFGQQNSSKSGLGAIEVSKPKKVRKRGNASGWFG